MSELPVPDDFGLVTEKLTLFSLSVNREISVTHTITQTVTHTRC